MAHRHVFEAVDRMLRDITNTDLPFGGKVVLMGGDFRQILPVVPRGSRAQTEAACIKNSGSIWAQVHILRLEENMRVRGGNASAGFANYLLRIGEGREESCEHNGRDSYIKLPDSMVITQGEHPSLMHSLVNRIYHDLPTRFGGPGYLLERAILSSKNSVVDEINALVTNNFPGEARVYFSQDAPLDVESTAIYPVEFLNAINPPGMPPHILTLKVGQPIMLLRNLDAQRGLCNGTRLLCRQLSQRYIQAEILLGQHRGGTVIIPRIPLHTTDTPTNPVQFRRRQFPHQARICNDHYQVARSDA